MWFVFIVKCLVILYVALLGSNKHRHAALMTFTRFCFSVAIFVSWHRKGICVEMEYATFCGNINGFFSGVVCLSQKYVQYLFFFHKNYRFLGSQER